MKISLGITGLFFWSLLTFAGSMAPATPGDFILREVRYEARLADDEARFAVTLDADCTGKQGGAMPLFEGDVALLPGKLPSALRITREGDRYILNAARPGKYNCTVELVAKIQRDEPWDQVSFTGPAAAIASITAQAGAGTEVQLLSGTLVDSAQTNGLSLARGLLGGDQSVALRWQGKVAEVARKAIITADTVASAQITPTVIKFTTQVHYEIVQGNAGQLTLALPAAQALTRLAGDQIRDWQVKADGGRQILTVEFIKAVEKNYDLTIFSEQVVDGSLGAARLEPPQPLEIERESGSFTISSEDMLAETETLEGLRQVNAPDGALAAYRFNSRPFTLALRIKRIEPVISTTDRVEARLEETRLMVSHHVSLNVDKAGIYAVEFSPQPGLAVTDARGDGVEDWKVADGKLQVNFSARVLGAREVEVQLEQALKQFPGRISVLPLRATGAVRESAQIGAAFAPGIQLKTGELTGLREIPVNKLEDRTDELLAYHAESPDWQLNLGSERLAPRIVADVFNLVTIGDGLVGGSATIRYGIINQGAQEFQVKVPANCRNVEFTGPNIRRKEQAGDVWTIGLQDKAWGGYTLVVTYDYQFDPTGAALPIGGIHALGTERETGSIAITTATSLKLTPKSPGEPLHRVDETELSDIDRTLITRAVVLAYQYTGGDYALEVEAQRHEELPVLEAVADHTQITSVLTEAGEMLTQASFMVKNNAKQSQRFQMPAGADFWSCYVDGAAAKPERDGDWIVVPLPRAANRDQSFAVDIVYAEKKGALTSKLPHSLALAAPRTDVPNTYAEWELYVPASQRLSSFGGNMNVAEGTTYGLLDAWQKFLSFYYQVLREAGASILVIGLLSALVIGLVISAARRGMSGVLTLLAVVAMLAVLSAMLLPALSKAKARAQRISSVNNLKQVGLAARQFALDNGDRFPKSFDEMKDELNTDRITYDVATGQRFVYLGAGLPMDSLTPDSIIAYSPLVNDQCDVLLADGSVQMINGERFAEFSQRGLIQFANPADVAARQQAAAIAAAQMDSTATNGVQTFGGETRGLAGHSVGGVISGVVDGYVTAAAGPAVNQNDAAPPEASEPPSPPSGGVSGLELPPVAKGLRSIHIDIPREGHAFLFTKVLSIDDKPLSVSARIMSLETFRNLQMAGQTLAFLAGLAVWFWQWRRVRPNTFILTCALALVIVSVASLLVAWRALHDALIIGFPVVVLGVAAWIIWRYFSRRRVAGTEPEGGISPAMATAGLIVLLSLAGVRTGTAAEAPMRQAPVASILEANYTGVVNDRVAEVEATLRVSAVGAGAVIPLFGGDVAIEQFSVKAGEAKLVREGDTVSARLGKGDPTLLIKLVAKIAGDVTRRRLEFNIPPALSSQVALSVEEGEADVDFPTAISYQRTADKDRTRVEAVIGSADRVQLLWTPRVKRAEEVAATVFCQNSSLVDFGGGVMHVRAVLDYQVTQGELRQARVVLPAGQRLLRVEGESIRTWEIKDEAGTQTLVVELLKGVLPAWRLTVETERTLDALPASVEVETPHALDVKRESGLVALRGAEELTLSVESTRDLQRVDAEEFNRALGSDAGALMSVFQFLKPEFELRARAETVQPEIEAVVRNQMRVASDQVSLTATIDYTIKRAGVFALRAALPADYRIEQVTGANVSQWQERTDGGVRELEVDLKERTSGAYTLTIELAQSLKELPKTLVVPGVQPVDAGKLNGFVSIVAEPGVALKTEAFDGLTEIPAVALPDGGQPVAAGGVLAYKYIATDPQAVQPWKLLVATETVEPWLRAEMVNTFTLTETLISGRALVHYDIANAPVKELRLRVPAAFKNVEITGPNIRQRDQQGDVWSVELQSRTHGEYLLTVTWEEPRTGGDKADKVALEGVTALDVERETGVLAVVAKAPLQVTELTASELQSVDTRDLPEWAGNPADATVLAYRYVRPGYQLAVEAQRYDEAQVLQAMVDQARLTTVVAEDGQVMTEMALTVRNNGRQFLEVGLPAGATVWSAFVAGQPVRPSRLEDKLLLPLQERGADNETVTVDLTYVSTNSFPRLRGLVSFASPRLDVPLKNAEWELFLPADYDYDHFAGTMTRETTSAPALESFGLSEYTLQEKEARRSDLAEAAKDVNEAESNLSAGNVHEAVNNLYRAKAKQLSGGTGGEGIRNLEDQLSTFQAGNLINAQQAFSSANAEPGDENKSPEGVAVYDDDVAKAQWQKLAQAQEVSVSAVQPLHVNLPLRGLRYSFTQVLQTEANEPMLIHFLAVNGKTGNWLLRVGVGLVGFSVLWALVSLVSARRHGMA